MLLSFASFALVNILARPQILTKMYAVTGERVAYVQLCTATGLNSTRLILTKASSPSLSLVTLPITWNHL